MLTEAPKNGVFKVKMLGRSICDITGEVRQKIIAALNTTYNCEPLVLGPWLAMQSTPLPSCNKFLWNSSGKGFFHMDSPPLPVPSGSPP